MCQHCAVNARVIGRVLFVVSAMTLALLTGPINLPSAQADPCPNAEVVFARGTGGSSGVGAVGQSFIDSLRSQIGGRSLGVYAVNYPATWAFASSVPAGADDVTNHVTGHDGTLPQHPDRAGRDFSGRGCHGFRY